MKTRAKPLSSITKQLLDLAGATGAERAKARAWTEATLYFSAL
jgi:hypothetical protein